MESDMHRTAPRAAVAALFLAATAACAPAATVSAPAGADGVMFPENLPATIEVVAHAPVAHTLTSELWVFRGVDGRDYAYTGTWGGCPDCIGDRVYAWDVTDRQNPVLTDSVMVDARIINDVMTNEAGTLAVLTREGASSRRNGIVILDLADPAHPTVLSEYTETLTGGVHVIYVDGDYVYATNNGTGDMHVVSIADPANPREVSRWGLETPRRYLHDVWVEDGLAYLSYWDDGMVVLDVGNGIRGGTPERPMKVSQLTYRTRWQGREYGNTHQAIPYTNAAGNSYIFVGDEIIPREASDPRSEVAPGGYIHVVDASDITNPRIVGRYEVPGAGAHNMWAEGERLYIAYYNAGLRVLDISGTLEGDLRAQGRELAVFEPASEEAFVPGRAMTWSPRLFDGHLFASDMYSGLWITRFVE
jgi:hypothetical protein